MYKTLDLEVQLIEINASEYITEAFKRDKTQHDSIPTNSIFDKTLPGLGATHSEILAKRNSIIIEPNVPVIIGKVKDRKDLLGVYEGRKETQIKNYLLNEKIEHKKILCTPEGYEKIKKVALNNDIDLYQDYFCLYDECEKITQDIDYRDSISLPMNDFFLYHKKAFVSATPLKLRNPQFTKHNFFIYKVKPNYDYIKEINLITTNNYESAIIQLLDKLKDSECICVFMNSTNGINKLINHLETNNIHDYKAFCSKKSELKFKEKEISQSFENLDLPLAKYNFFTSRFFSAVDIHSLKKPDIIILTDLTEAKHSRIDPFTNTIQIYGRFRDSFDDGTKFNSLTHISNYGEDYWDILNEEEINSYIIKSQKIYNQFKKEIDKQLDKGEREALKDSLAGCSYNKFIDEDGTLNYFKLDNFFDNERVKAYYSTPQKLLSAYEDTQHFKIHFTDFHYTISDHDKLYYKRLKSGIERRIFVIRKLDAIYSSNKLTSTDKDVAKNELLMIGDWTTQEENKYAIQAFELLGFKAIEQVDFYKNEIDKLLKEHKKQSNHKKMFSKEVTEAILKKFPQSNTYDEIELFQGFEVIFRNYGISHKVNLNTVRKYYGADQLKGQNTGKIKLRLFEPDYIL